MASKTQEEILKQFETAAWKPAAGAREEAARDAYLASAIEPTGHAWSTGRRAAVVDAAATPSGENIRGGSAIEGTNGSAGSTAATVIKDIFETGLGVVPLIGGLLGLFGGGSEPPPQPVKYQMPSPISFMSADVGHDLLAADYDQMGLPRSYDAGGYGIGDLSASDLDELPTAADLAYDPQSTSRSQALPDPSAGQKSGNATAPAQITVNVQAMDAQSFLDRNRDIAEAVRSAMLTMSSINDVVNEL